MRKAPSIVVVVVRKISKFSQRSTSQYTHLWFVRFISIFHTPTLFFPETFSYQWYLHITHAAYQYIFPIGRTDVPHNTCLISFLSILVFFIWHLLDLMFFPHFDFWFIFCFLFLNSSRYCFCGLGVSISA